MIEAAEAHSHHKDHRQSQHLDEVRDLLPIVQRHPESANPFDHDHIGEGAELEKYGFDSREFDPGASLGCGDVRCDRRQETVRIDQIHW